MHRSHHRLYPAPSDNQARHNHLIWPPKTIKHPCILRRSKFPNGAQPLIKQLISSTKEIVFTTKSEKNIYKKCVLDLNTWKFQWDWPGQATHARFVRSHRRGHEATMEIPRVGSKPWPTVHRISLTFSWRRTSAAVETEEATYQPRVVANVENNLGGGGEIPNPKKASTKKRRNHSPARTPGGRGRRRTVTFLRRGSRRRLAEYREEKGLLSSTFLES